MGCNASRDVNEESINPSCGSNRICPQPIANPLRPLASSFDGHAIVCEAAPCEPTTPRTSRRSARPTRLLEQRPSSIVLPSGEGSSTSTTGTPSQPRSCGKPPLYPQAAAPLTPNTPPVRKPSKLSKPEVPSRIDFSSHEAELDRVMMSWQAASRRKAEDKIASAATSPLA